MNKKVLTYVNLALGSLSMTLAGCHTQKVAPQPAAPQEPDRPVVEEPLPIIQEEQPQEPLVCKYGVPPEVYERPMRKYGGPDMREK